MLDKDELNIRMITYVLALENHKYYVGKTWNLNMRYAQHLCGRGAGWTIIHKPISLMEVWWGDHEKELCLDYMREFGYQNVRGAGWCKTYINKPAELLSCVSINGVNLHNSRDNSETVISSNVGRNEGGGIGRTE